MTFSQHILTGDHTSLPLATAVPSGAIYSCTTHSRVYQSDGSAWADYISPPASAASELGSWNYSRTRGGTPADKGLRLSADIVVGTPNAVLVDDNEIGGADRSPYLALLSSGDNIFIDDHNGNIARAVLTSAPVDHTGYWEFPFTPSGAYPMAAEPPNGSNVTFGWQAAAGGSSSPMTVRGAVSSAGAVVRGSGFTPAKVGTGHYTLTFSPAFAAVPVVVAMTSPDTPAISNGQYPQIDNDASSTSVVHVYTIQGTTGNATDCAFNFVAMAV